MWFRTSRIGDVTDFSNPSHHPLRPAAPRPVSSEERADEEILVYFAPVELMRFVLGRMVQSLAASSHFSVTKLSDLRAVNEAFAGYIEEASDGDGAVSITISSSSRRLLMKTSRLSAHDPESAQEALSKVVDTLSAERENVCIELLDRTRDPISDLTPARGGETRQDTG